MLKTLSDVKRTYKVLFKKVMRQFMPIQRGCFPQTFFCNWRIAMTGKEFKIDFNKTA